MSDSISTPTGSGVEATVHAVQEMQLKGLTAKMVAFEQEREKDKTEILSAIKEGFGRIDRKFEEHDDRINKVENKGRYTPIQIVMGILSIMASAAVPAGWVYWASLGPIKDQQLAQARGLEAMESRSSDRFKTTMDALTTHEKLSMHEGTRGEFNRLNAALNRQETQLSKASAEWNMDRAETRSLIRQMWPRDRPVDPPDPIRYFPEVGTDSGTPHSETGLPTIR